MNSQCVGLVFAVVLCVVPQLRADVRLGPGPNYPAPSIPAPGSNILPPGLFVNRPGIGPGYGPGAYPYNNYATTYPYYSGYYSGYGYGGYGGGGVVVVNPPPVVVNNYVGPPVDTPQTAPAPTPTVTPDAPPADPTTAQVRLLVPADAEVWVQGVKMTQAGTTRRFVSPKLQAGKDYTYEVRVVMHDSAGKEVVRNLSVGVRAGDSKSVYVVAPPANVAEVMPVPAVR